MTAETETTTVDPRESALVARRMVALLVERALAPLDVDALDELARGARIVLPVSAWLLEDEGVPRAVARAIVAAALTSSRVVARAAVEAARAEGWTAAAAAAAAEDGDGGGFGCGNPTCVECSTRLI